MKYLQKIAHWIAVTGTDPEFIAFNAHCWFAFMLVSISPDKPWAVIGVNVFALLKEFWFDKHFEQPPQTFHENLLDFVGYSIGAALAFLFPNTKQTLHVQRIILSPCLMVVSISI